MEDNNWSGSIEAKILLLKEKMAGDRANLKQLDILLKLSQRIAAFSSDCSECSNLKMQITVAINNLSDWPDITDEQNENYVNTAKNANRHIVGIHDSTTRNRGLILIGAGITGIVGAIIWSLIEPTNNILPPLIIALSLPSLLLGTIYVLIFYAIKRR